MQTTIKKGSRTEVVEMEVGNVIQFENLTFQNAYWAIVTGIITKGENEVVGMNVLVIDPDTLKPMIWSTGEFRFDTAFVQNNIFEHFETVADYLDWKVDGDE
jgi:hypothetical protein